MKSSSFFERVYAVVRHIPPGKVTSYGRIAQMLDSPGAARQVGFAMAALKHRDEDSHYGDLPWQRVINVRGGISMWGSPLARLRQAELLREEDVEVSEDLVVDLDRYLWEGLLPHEVQKILKNDREKHT